jgi:hypothetical protein
MSLNGKIPTIFLVVLLLSGFLILLDYAPKYLTYSDKIEKSGAVVFFVGPDYRARQKEVNWLIAEGYARYLIIPSCGEIRDVSFLSIKATTEAVSRKIIISDPKYKTYFENTHIEILEAKRMMDQHHLMSAIFVSSPYHMRRIKIMTDKIFRGNSPTIIFVPSRFETVHYDLLSSNWKDLMQEYVKIAWFITYSMFVIT